MAHYAEIDSNNNILQVIVINNTELDDGSGEENPAAGVAYCMSHDFNIGQSSTWKQTSYNNNLRARYAAIGGTYDPVNDVFIDPQPYPSWTLDTNTNWQPPVPYPTDGALYKWNETNKSWDAA